MKLSKTRRPHNSSQLLSKPTCLTVLILIIGLASCGAPQAPDPLIPRELGQAIAAKDVFGMFYTYAPTNLSKETEIIVLIHGTPAKEETAEETAHYYIINWLDFAENYGYILIAPAFNQEDFSSREGDHALGGYRGLFGRIINADEWVLRLVTAHQKAFGIPARPFYLYGHSAGGQFVGRFLVTHPEQVKRAVITSAATYPQPNPEIAWPFGMGALSTEIKWDESTVKQTDVVPDKQKWLAATQVPLTVIVGLNDTAELPSYPGQKGNNRFGIGQSWVQDMEKFAEENRLESQIKIEIIPGKGHSMSALIPYSQKALILK
jgi:poly(3-hydroxybutyrate) depolymerase